MTARVHEVKKSRVAFPGIPVGSHYYWWKFAYHEAIRSLTRPKPSQLTQSAFVSEALSIQEDMNELGTGDIREGCFDISDCADRIRQLGEQASDSLSNMPDALQQSPTGELLQNRADNCEQWASDLEGVDMDIDENSIRSDAEQEAIQDPRYKTDDADNGELIEDIFDEKMDERAEEILDEISSVNSSADIE